MKKCSAILLLCLLCGVVYPAMARTGSISGKVLDEEGKSVIYASIFLLKAADSTLITTSLSDENGLFTLEPKDAGTFILKVTLVGYTNYTSNKITVAESNVSVPDIKMTQNGKQLKEAVVTAQKPFIEVHADKLVVNVENSIVSTGSNVLEILSRSPGITVDQNDNISLKGKQGVNVMIDGRIVPMSSADLANMLKSMPSNSVDKIEIISNPPAKYDAAGTAGIINIKTKKDQHMGLNGSVTAGYGQGTYGKQNGGFSLNYREKKLSMYANYNAAFRTDYHDVDWTRQYFTNDVLNKSYVQSNTSRLQLNSNNISVGADYKLTDKTTVGASVTGGDFYLGMNGNYKGHVRDSSGSLVSNFLTTTPSGGNWYDLAPNLHLQHTFDSTGRELSIDLDYGRYWNKNIQDLATRYTSPAGALLDSPYILHGDIKGLTQIRSLKVDYTHPLKNNLRIEAGIKVSYVTADNEPLFYNRRSNKPDSLLNGYSDHFIYTENINAAYINISKDWKKWSAQLGLRGEQTNITGNEKLSGQTFSNSYAQPFPSLALQNHIDKNNDLGVTLSRRIERPAYQDLNPYVLFVDPTTQKVGNPYLNPALTYAAELSHVYKQRLITTLSYSVTDNVITEAVYPSTSGGQTVTLQEKENLTAQYYFGLSGSYTIPIRKWWTCMTSYDVYYTKFRGNLANTSLNEGKVTFDINTNNRFTLPHDWSLEATFFYQSAQVYGFMDIQPYYMLNLGVQKTFLDKRLTARLNARDILYTSEQDGSSVFTDYTQVFVSKGDTRVVTVSFTYRFGKNTVAPVRKHSSGAEDEQRRAGNGGA